MTSQHVKRGSPADVAGHASKIVEPDTYPFGIWCTDIEDVPETTTASILSFYHTRRMIHEPTSSFSSEEEDVSLVEDCDPSFLYGDPDFDSSLDSFEVVHFDPEEWDENGDYIGIQRFLPWWFPKTLADYAIYNTFFPEAPLMFEDKEVPSLWKDTHQKGLSEDPEFNDMELIYQAAEMNYPTEYHGRRELDFYKDWNQFGIIDPIENDDDPMDVEEPPVVVDNHPKGLPGCNQILLLH